MHQLFVSPGSPFEANWRIAFGDARIVGPDAVTDAALEGADLVWLDGGRSAGLAGVARLLERATALKCKVVVMRAVLRETEAMQVLAGGARGLCHVGATAEQLRGIAQVVAQGGLWLPPAMVRKLAVLVRQLPAADTADTASAEARALEALSPRELQVARQVALGASNREIAGALHMSERTVKAHLSHIFQKLEVRDRVQLALLVSRAGAAADPAGRDGP